MQNSDIIFLPKVKIRQLMFLANEYPFSQKKWDLISSKAGLTLSAPEAIKIVFNDSIAKIKAMKKDDFNKLIQIAHSLSPENLSEDGELTAEEQEIKSADLLEYWAIYEKSWNFTMYPEDLEEWDFKNNY